MTLKDLGEEYIICADKLKKREQALKCDLSSLRGIRYLEASRDLKIIRDMERDSRSTGLYLVNYYDNKTDRRQYHRK